MGYRDGHKCGKTETKYFNNIIEPCGVQVNHYNDMKERTERIIGKTMRVFELIVFAIAIVGLCFLFCIADAKAQTNVVNREIVSRDTILATDYVHVTEYVNKSGKDAFKATWCGRSINISKSAAEDILGGSDAYVVIAKYNNGEVIRQKVITLYHN